MDAQEGLNERKYI